MPGKPVVMLKKSEFEHLPPTGTSGIQTRRFRERRQLTFEFFNIWVVTFLGPYPVDTRPVNKWILGQEEACKIDPTE